MTFDSWDVGIHPEAYLAHHGIKGMKHGRNRYQTESGEWTEEGLERRRKREGFGERKAAKAEKKAAKQAAKTEKREARKKAVADAKAAYIEKMRQKNIKNLSDAELKAKIERVKMEQEYKELTKSPLLKTGEKFVADYFKNKNERAERAYNERQVRLSREHELKKLDKEVEKTKLQTEADKKKAEADKARADTDKLDIESGTRMKSLKNQHENNVNQAKRFRADYTIVGGIKKLVNKTLSGRGDAASDIYKGYGEAKAAYVRGKTDAKIAVKQNKILTKRNNKLDPYDEKATIRESGQDYWRKEEKGNKKKKGGGG